MTKFITIEAHTDNGQVRVREVIEADVATGFIAAPREDISPGDVLTTEEQVKVGLLPQPASIEPAVEDVEQGGNMQNDGSSLDPLSVPPASSVDSVTITEP